MWIENKEDSWKNDLTGRAPHNNDLHDMVRYASGGGTLSNNNDNKKEKKMNMNMNLIVCLGI